MKHFVLTLAVVFVAANVGAAGSSVSKAANFRRKAQEMLNSLQRQSYDEAVSSGNLIDKELQRGADYIKTFKTEVVTLVQGLEDPTLSASEVAENVKNLLEMVQDRMSQYGLGSQIIAEIEDLNNQIGVLSNSKIDNFFKYLSGGGTSSHCFANEISRINAESSAVTAAIKADLQKLVEGKTFEVNGWITNLRELLGSFKASRSLPQIEGTITAVVTEGLKSDFWTKTMKDLKKTTQAIVSEAGSKLEQIKKDVDQCKM